MLHYGLAHWLHFMPFSLFRLSNQEHWQQKIWLLRKTGIQIPFPTIIPYQTEPKCFLLSGPFIIISSEQERLTDEVCWDPRPNTSLLYYNAHRRAASLSHQPKYTKEQHNLLEGKTANMDNHVSNFWDCIKYTKA